MKPANFPRNRERKQKEAKDRQASWAALSLKDQLKELDARPGASTRQRAKITFKLKEQKAQGKA